MSAIEYLRAFFQCVWVFLVASHPCVALARRGLDLRCNCMHLRFARGYHISLLPLFPGSMAPCNEPTRIAVCQILPLLSLQQCRRWLAAEHGCPHPHFVSSQVFAVPTHAKPRARVLPRVTTWPFVVPASQHACGNAHQMVARFFTR